MKRRRFQYRLAKVGTAVVLKEAAVLEPRSSMLINVRAAKDQLSSLLEHAARGNEVIITSDGHPKAKLVPFKSVRRPFRVDWALLGSVKPKAGAKSAEEIIREDRDGRP